MRQFLLQLPRRRTLRDLATGLLPFGVVAMGLAMDVAIGPLRSVPLIYALAVLVAAVRLSRVGVSLVTTFAGVAAVFPRGSTSLGEVATIALGLAAIGAGSFHLHDRWARAIHQATHDVLTGAVNRLEVDRLGLAMVETAISRYEELHVAIIDCDRFKRINDRFGHAAGDEVLKRLVKCLREPFRGVGMVARLGGDEFAVLMPRFSAEQAEWTLEQSRIAFEASMAAAGFETSFSFGIASLSPGTRDLRQLFKLADADMYRRKEAKLYGTLPFGEEAERGPSGRAVVSMPGDLAVR